MSSFDPAVLRTQFPALSQHVKGRPAVFLDAPGGTQVPQRVINAVSEYLAFSNANTHGAFATSMRTEKMLVEAHNAAADLLGCAPNEAAFGPNMTLLTFAVSRAIGREIEAGDEIIVTDLDHDANVAPWRALEECGATVRTAPIRCEDCTLDTAALLDLLNPKTKLVAVGMASNSVGSVNDVERITSAAHEVGAWVYLDAVHHAPHGPIDVRALDCDFLACSAYKFCGPHVGVVYGKREHMERLRPYKVRPAPDEIPDCWETGTQNHEGLAGLIAAVDYLADVGRRFGAAASEDRPDVSKRRGRVLAGMEAIQQYERGLAERLIQGLLGIEGLTFYGITDPEKFDRRVPTVSIRIEGRHPREIAESLGREGFFVWDGNYYALSLSERLGVEPTGGMVRIGLAHYNTAEEVDRLLEALGQGAD